MLLEGVFVTVNCVPMTVRKSVESIQTMSVRFGISVSLELSRFSSSNGEVERHKRMVEYSMAYCGAI